MELFTDEIIRALLASSLKTASHDGKGRVDPGGGGGSRHAQYIDFITIKNQEQSVADDVERLRRSPPVPRDIPIYGFIDSVESGRLVEVPEATKIGRPQ
jgi:carbonic anhydrase